jgi:hypothetical protein
MYGKNRQHPCEDGYIDIVNVLMVIVPARKNIMIMIGKMDPTWIIKHKTKEDTMRIMTMTVAVKAVAVVVVVVAPTRRANIDSTQNEYHNPLS